jgi:HAD superfamily hydrolase (TIGR01459 family)
MKKITRITEISADYDGYVIDLWGVMHDGTTAYPHAKEAIAQLAAQGKRVVFLSNAPRRAEMARVTLDAFDIPRAHYQEVISSGEVAYDHLKSGSVYGKRYYYLGPSKDEEVLDGTECVRVETPEEADFILNAGFEYDFQPVEEIETLLQKLLACELPLICINPDLEVVKIDGTRMWCAGWVAQRYDALGGKVVYYGKPHVDVYAAAFARLDGVAKERILAIGDNLLTDIRGANAAGIASLLITGGILTAEAGKAPDDATLQVAMAEAAATPEYLADLFR